MMEGVRRLAGTIGIVLTVVLAVTPLTNVVSARPDRDGASSTVERSSGGTGGRVERARDERPYRAAIARIPRATRERMRGSSWRPGCPVALRDLRLLRLTHRNFRGHRVWGKLVVHESFAQKLKRVFSKVYESRFRIRRMHLVDRYDAVDMRSMRHDNTSAFNCRYRNGECCTWSMHAFGKAIDINPVENPYVGSWGVSPPNGADYVDRSERRKGMIFKRDPVWRAFRRIGWPWGGTWSGSKDYQHFSSNGR